MQKFDQWCEANPDDAAALRKVIGKKTLHKYRRGDLTRVDPETIKAIVDVTKHHITADDFYGIDRRAAAKAALRK